MLALELPYSELIVPGIVFGILGIGAIAAARFWPESKRPVVTAVLPVETTLLAADGTSAIDLEAEAETAGPTVAVTRSVTWPALIDPDAGQLSDAERLHVIEGLGLAGDARCASILHQAYAEEDDELRLAVVEALGTCEGDIVAPTLERAYASHVVPERYAAIDGASRRGDVPLLERALHDPAPVVALAAAYGLHRAARPDIIERELADRTDPAASEVRRVLPMLL